MRAMIVDDEAVARSAMQRRIKWENYGIDQVYSAESMRQAIGIMEQDAVDLMLCDVEMPGGSGLELYEWVRTYRPEIECIFVSCHPEYEYVRKALTMGSMDYVLKPVDYEEMDRILRDASQRILNRRNEDSVQHQGTGSAPAEEGITEPMGKAEKKYPSDAVNEAVVYVKDHLGYNISISEIADAVHLNPQYFMRLFKKETGQSVLEFITDYRLHKAKEMLRTTSLPITEVALSAGYDNFSYFSKLFKRYEGMSPSDYRRANQ